MDEALPIESLAGVPGAPARSQLSPKYWAFVSYSHHDQTWGDWLHKALETYRVPYKLVGRSSPHGKIPRRLFPIFRDCFELPAAGNLGAQLDEALQRSRYLVVVCSPSAAASRWVNEEIRTFKIIGSEDRVLALIVEGEPNASVRSDGKELECFPPALRFRVTPDGKISKTPAEPIAADVRPGQDSKAAAKLRLIAGLIGVSFDELRQRERRRRVWRVVQIGLSMLLVAALVQGVWIVQEIQKQTQLRRQAIENYVTLGQKELRAGSLVRAAVYLNQAYKRGEDSLKLRYLLGRALPALDVQAARLRDRGPPVVSTAFDAQGRYLLSLGQPSEVKVWDAAAGRLLATLDQHRAPVSSAVFSHDGKYIVTASYDRTAKIWEAHTGRLVHSLEGHASLLETAVYSPDDALLVTLGADGTGHLWNPVSGKMLRELDRSFPAKVPVAFSPDGSRLVTAAGSRFAVLWSTAEGRVVQVLAGHKGRVNDARFSPDGKKLVTASDDGSLRIWQAERGDALVTWESGAGPLACSVTVISLQSDER